MPRVAIYNPTPTVSPLTDAELRATPVPVDVGTVAVTGGLTDTQLRATPVPVSGTVTTGGLTDTQLRASPVPVSGTVATGGLTDAELRATAVPVSGTVATGGLTDTELRATAVPVSLASTVPYAPLSSAVDGYAALTATGDTALIAAPGGSTRIYITSFSASNTSATAVRIDLKDGSTVKHSFYLAASGGGMSHLFPFPWRLTAATALNVAISGAVTDVRVSATGFTAL